MPREVSGDYGAEGGIGGEKGYGHSKTFFIETFVVGTIDVT